MRLGRVFEKKRFTLAALGLILLYALVRMVLVRCGL